MDSLTQKREDIEERRGRSWHLPATIGGLFLLLVVAAWLRIDYLRSANLHVDEFTTLWAAQQVREQGAPIMPSGVLYTRGLLYTYLLAALEILFDAGRATAFALSMVTGLVTIVVVWIVGRRHWSAAVGWLAAVGLTLLPEAIIWSSRARFYAQLQLFVLLALWAAWESIREPAQNRRKAWLWQGAFALAFICALYSQEQAILLWPVALLAMVFWRGWRWLFTPPVLTAQIAVAVAIGARLAIEIAGQPGYFETIQSTRPYLGLIFDIVGAWRTYAPLLIGGGHLVWTVAALIAVAVALVVAIRSRSLTRIAPEHQSTLYFALPVAGILASLFLLVGTSWRDTRYLLLVQPFWLLLGAAGIVWLLRWVATAAGRPHWTAALAGSACVAMALYALTGWGALDRQEENFEQAFRRVVEQRAEGSAVLSPQPPACAWVLGEPCDGYAIQRGYEEYVIPNADGTLVDRWTGAPLIDTTEKLAQVLRDHPQTWLVSDAFRLATRYDQAYLRTIIEQFEPIAEEEGAMVLRADGWKTLPQLDESIVFSPTLRFGPLELTAFSYNRNFTDTIDIALGWTAAEPIDGQINTSVRLVNQNGEIVSQIDGPPANGIIPTTLFGDMPLPDRKTLEMPWDKLIQFEHSRNRIEIAVYAVGEEITPLGEPQPVWWFNAGSDHIALTKPLGMWENGVILTDADVEVNGEYTQQVGNVRAGDQIAVHIQWLTDTPTETPLIGFVHLLGPDGTVIAQDDHEPDDGFYPTNRWQFGTVASEFIFALPDVLPAGEYRMVTGWYDKATSKRVPVSDGADTIEIARLEIE